MEKKVEIEVNGHRLLVAEHMLETYARFGAYQTKRTIKEVPVELLKVPIKPVEIKKDVLPEMVITEQVKEVKPVTVFEKLPEVINTEKVFEPVKKIRKAPVRSKSKK